AFAALVDSGVTGPVNIASGEPVPVREIVSILAELAGRPDLPRFGAVPDRPGDPPLLMGDVRRLRDEAGFTPRYPLRGGLGVALAVKVSVLIPTRERLEYLRYAVESVRRQTFSDWEIVIADNASSEDIGGYVDSLGEPRIVYRRSETPLPVTENWNVALDAAT